MAASSWTFFRNVIALSLAHSLPVIRHLAGNLSHRQSLVPRAVPEMSTRRVDSFIKPRMTKPAKPDRFDGAIVKKSVATI